MALLVVREQGIVGFEKGNQECVFFGGSAESREGLREQLGLLAVDIEEEGGMCIFRCE